MKFIKRTLLLVGMIVIYNTIRMNQIVYASSNTIKNGIYEIEVSANSNFLIDVSEGSQNNCANIQIWNRANVKQQQFEITSNGNYYIIRAVHSNKVLDVANGNAYSGANVWQYTNNNSNAQLWTIKKNSNNTYSFYSKLNSNLCIDVSEAKYKNGSNIQLYENNGTSAQQFNLKCIKEYETISPQKTVDEGFYIIKSKINSNYVFDIAGGSTKDNANLQLYKENQTLAQYFKLNYNDGYYTIESYKSKKMLDVDCANTSNGTNIKQYSSNNNSAQKWVIYKNNDNTYSFLSKLDFDKAMDVTNGVAANSTNIQLYKWYKNDAQKFILEKINEEDIVEPVSAEKTIDEGIYEIASSLNSNYILDVSSASTSNGANIQLWQKSNVEQQKFKLAYSNGYYIISPIHSNKCLDIEGGANCYKTNVWQHEKNNTNAQKWKIIKNDDNTYTFVSAISDRLYLNIASNNAYNGSNVNVDKKSSNNNQKFILTKVADLSGIDSDKYPGFSNRIISLSEKHPNWKFRFLYVGENFSTAVDGEYNYAYKTACLVDTRTYQGDDWVANNPYHSGVWYSASKKAIAYFMDTRNFLNEVDVFQFLDLNEYQSASVSMSEINNQVSGTCMQDYANDINNACYTENVNPYFVIARIFQEQGKRGSSTLKMASDGKYYYNPFNIGAQVGNDYNTALAKAKEKGWDTMEKAIRGGITFLKTNWLENYQNTLYQQKFDIDKTNGSALYQHQYMQNLSAAFSEAKTLQSCYTHSGKLDSSLTFVIPVYENAPTTLSPKPITSSGSSSSYSANLGPKDVRVTASSGLNVRASASTSSSKIGFLYHGDELLSVKRAINGNWHQVVLDNGTLGYCSGDYLEFIADKTNCNTKKTINENSVNLRSGPGTDTDSLGYYSYGNQVTVICSGKYNRCGYVWDRVVTSDGAQGFIVNRFLK